MNKMFKKILAVAAVAATAACMSVSAFAADVTVAPENASVSVGAEAVTNATQYTVMVFKTTADITDADAVKAATPQVADIYYINQGDNVATLVKDMLVKATTVKNEDNTETTTYLPEGSYIVRVGNDTGSVQNFTLECKVEEESITLTIGDVNGDGSANETDASLILQKGVGLLDNFLHSVDSTVIPEGAGDVNGDGSANETDASLILQKGVGLIENFTHFETGEILIEFKYSKTN